MSGGTLASVGGTLGGFGVAALVAAIVIRVPSAVPWAIALAGIGYIVGREHQDLVDGWAAAVGAALLLSAELASWSIDDDRRIRQERALVLRRVLVIAGLVAAAALVSFVLVGAAAVSASAGLLLTAVGVAAAVTSVTLILRLLRG